MKSMAVGLLILSPVVAAPQAGATLDDATVYARCIIDRQVPDPKNIPFADSSACLTSMGIPDPGEKSRKEAKDRWRDCLIDRALALDDGVSSVSDVATVIAPMCEAEWGAVADTLWAIPSIKSKLKKEVRSYGSESAAQIVLLSRKVKAETKPLKN
ncbi:hypothetical protein [Hydrogenophaga sp.]|uniref:hypothetical protein n=1 Tax=Hydrogenophaga sp. TaxID=1904254 RepID=UPI0025BD98A6|nr:hypothetical protein [Hydrogenophaga sp.]